MSCNTVKTFVLLQPYFGHLSCMPVVCVTHYKTSKGCFLFESKVEKLFPQLGFLTESLWLFGYTPDISITTMQPGTPPGTDV